MQIRDVWKKTSDICCSRPRFSSGGVLGTLAGMIGAFCYANAQYMEQKPMLILVAAGGVGGYWAGLALSNVAHTIADAKKREARALQVRKIVQGCEKEDLLPSPRLSRPMPRFFLREHVQRRHEEDVRWKIIAGNDPFWREMGEVDKRAILAARGAAGSLAPR